MIGLQPRAIRWTGRAPTVWKQDGFRRIRDAKAHSEERQGRPSMLINMMPLERAGGPLVMRPGLKRTAATTLQLGAGASGSTTRKCQGWFQGNLTGTEQTYAWVGQELYQINVGTNTATLKISAAALAAATGGAVVLSTNDQIFGCVFAGKAIFVQSGATCPFSWNGTALGGVARLTNAPAACVGGPTVYYAKLFLIKSPGTTIVWSEENQENTGYEAGGFNNAWSLTQTNQNALGQIIGTNEGLYYGRGGAIGIIRGAVSSTFTTDGVHESVSDRVGIDSPGSNASGRQMFWHGGKLWWVDDMQRPWVYQQGSGAHPIWEDLPRWFNQHQGYLPPDTDLFHVGEEVFFSLSLLGITDDPGNDVVRFHYASSGGGAAPATANQRIDLVVDGTTGEPICWDIFPTVNLICATPRTILPIFWGNYDGSQVDVAGELVIDVAGFLFTRAYANISGGSYIPSYFDETESATGSAVVGTVVGPEHGYRGRGEVKFTDLDLVVAGQTSQSVSAGVLTSRQQRLSLSPVQTLTDAPTATVPFERHVPFGVNRDGRWGRVVARVQAGATTDTPQRPEIHGWELRGYPVSDTHAVT